MNHSLSWLTARLAHRGDSEHGQAMIRIAVLSVVLVYLLLHGSGVATADPDATAYPYVLKLVFVGFVVGVGLIGWIVASPAMLT